jgi:transposase
MEETVDASEDPKTESLRERYALNPHPHKVTDPLFLKNEFFDPRDLVQVKYEMLRRVRIEGMTVTQAAQAFGFSRPVFYQALAAFEEDGLPGLVPRRPGPKGAHKLTDEILGYLQQQQALDQALRAGTLSKQVLEKFGLSVHPRSIERALKRRRTKE